MFKRYRVPKHLHIISQTEKKKVSTTDITGPVGAVGAVKTSGLGQSNISARQLLVNILYCA